MKLKGSLFVMFSLLLTSLFITGCSNNKNKKDTTKETVTTDNTTSEDKKDPVTPDDPGNPDLNDYTVSQEVFDKYFKIDKNSLKNLNLTINTDSTVNNHNYKDIIKFDGTNLYLDRPSETFKSFSHITNTDSDIIFDKYTYNATDPYWHFSEKNADKSIDLFVTQYLMLASFNYSDFTFNSETNFYEKDSITDSLIGTYSNIKIKFIDDKLNSFSYDLIDLGNYTYKMDATVSDVDNTTFEAINRYVVSKETFDSYFKINSIDPLMLLNYTANYTVTGSRNASATVKANAGYFIVESLIGENDIMSDFFITEGSDGTYLDYIHYRVMGDSWYEMGAGRDEFKVFLYEDILLESFGYENFKYVESSKMYEASEFIKDGKEYSDIKIKFLDDKIVSYSYTTTDEYNKTFNVLAEFSNVGDTVVYGPVRHFVDEDVFNSYFGSYIDALSKLNMTVSYDNGRYNGTLKMDNCKFMDSYSAISFSDNGQKYYEITNYNNETNVITYDYAYYNTAWSTMAERNIMINDFYDLVYIFTLDYNEFVFNRTNRKYEADTIITEYGTYKDITICFLNDKLVGYTYKFTDLIGNSKTVTCDVTKIGETVVTNPFLA